MRVGKYACNGSQGMGKSLPYVRTEDKLLLKSHATAIVAYARSIGKNTVEFMARDVRGYIDFLWKTAHERDVGRQHRRTRRRRYVTPSR